MTKAEIKELIEEKENKINKYESIQYFNIKFFTIISLLCFFICVTVGIVMIVLLYNLNNAIFISASSLSFVLAGIIFVIYLPTLIYYMVKKSNAPKAISELEKEIEILKLGLDK